jgi:hypothetical protein
MVHEDHHSISKEAHQEVLEKLSKPSPGRKVLAESPIVEVKRAELLLGILTEERALPRFILNFKDGDERCKNCYRHFSVLDLISTALREHTAQFLKQILFSPKIVHGGGGQKLRCFDCGVEGDEPPAYGTPTYACCF